MKNVIMRSFFLVLFFIFIILIGQIIIPQKVKTSTAILVGAGFVLGDFMIRCYSYKKNNKLQ
jgi:hypothetical protein